MKNISYILFDRISNKTFSPVIVNKNCDEIFPVNNFLWKFQSNIKIIKISSKI